MSLCHVCHVFSLLCEVSVNFVCVCVRLFYVKFVCVKRLYVRLLYVKFVCGTFV